MTHHIIQHIPGGLKIFSMEEEESVCSVCGNRMFEICNEYNELSDLLAPDTQDTTERMFGCSEPPVECSEDPELCEGCYVEPDPMPTQEEAGVSDSDFYSE